MNLASKYQPLDEATLRKLFDLHYNSLCRFATGYLTDADAAEDIVQQVFINLWNHREEIQPDKSINSYLFTAVKNRCLNRIRDHKKYRSYYLDVELELEIPVEDKDTFSEAELENRLNMALDKLPEKCREVFILCRFEEMKYKEVADKLNISAKTVEAQMSKALKILREEFKDLWFVVLMLFLWQ